MRNDPESESGIPHSAFRIPHFLLPALLALLICASVWPTLGWSEFGNGSEQLVVAAALESSREGRVLVPVMNGEPRLRKPPLTTWAAMAAAPDAAALADGPVDDAAYRSAAVRVRTAALGFAFLLLLATFELGRVLGGRDVGLIALAVCGSTFFFVEQSIRLTTDLTLAVFVVGANVAVAHALVRGRILSGCAVAGVLLGLGFLAKGPVALVQTVVPAGVVWVSAGIVPRVLSVDPRLPPRLRGSAVSTGVLLFATIALPWFGWVLAREPGAWAVWTTEVSRTDETVPASDVLAYAVGLALVAPWTPFVVLGLLNALAEHLRRLGWRPRALRKFARLRGPGMAYALALVLVPILVMTLFRDRKDRYLLPILGPTAVLAGTAVTLVFRDRRRRPAGAKLIFGLHYAILGIICLGVPITAMLLTRNEYDPAAGPWLSSAVGVPLLVVGGIVFAAALLAFRRWGQAGFVAGSVACVMFAANAFLLGYGGTREAKADLKPIAEAVRAEVPNAAMWYLDEPPPPGLLIYAGRTVRPFAGELAEGVPNVLVVRQRKREPEPAPPPGFDVLATARRDSSVWWAFVDRR